MRAHTDARRAAPTSALATRPARRHRRHGGGDGAAGGGTAGHGGHRRHHRHGGVRCATRTRPICRPTSNCGTCFNNCTAPNSTPALRRRHVQVHVPPGFFDADKNAGQRLRVQPDQRRRRDLRRRSTTTATAPSTRASTSRATSTTAAAATGAASTRSRRPAATSGVCKQGACLPASTIAIPNVPGCETACQKTNGGVEICDGLDNDCDGIVDDNLGAADDHVHDQGVCAGTQPTCTGTSGWVCNYPATYQASRTPKGCDSLDNDCDGLVDEPFDIGKACVFGTGPCAGTGTWICDTRDRQPRCIGSMKTPGVEVCNGKDDDCDGKVDELDKLSDRTTDDKMVYFTAGDAQRHDVRLRGHPLRRDGDQHTASIRPAAPAPSRASSPGRTSRRKRPRRPARRPAPAGALHGHRMERRLQRRRRTRPSRTATPTAARECNGYDYTHGEPGGDRPDRRRHDCVSDHSAAAGDELYDMSGNVKEWVVSVTHAREPTADAARFRAARRRLRHRQLRRQLGDARRDPRARPAVRRLRPRPRPARRPAAFSRLPLLPIRNAAAMTRGRALGRTRGSKLDHCRRGARARRDAWRLARRRARRSRCAPTSSSSSIRPGRCSTTTANDGSTLCNSSERARPAASTA